MITEKDKSIILHIQSNNQKLRNNALKIIYETCYNQVEVFIVRNGGCANEAKDVFQEAVMILYHNICNEKFKGNSSISTYVYSICRNLWFQTVKRRPINVTFHAKDYELSQEEFHDSQINVEFLNSAIAELRHDCKQILKSFYFDYKSIKDLAIDFKLGSDQAAKNKKSRCLKYLADVIHKKGLKQENFIK